jgi:hypothetical protein
MRLWCKMRPQLRRRRFSRHITFYKHLREGTHGGPRAAGSEAWQAKRQLTLPIRRYGYFRSVIRETVYKYLGCGDLRQGFARVRCRDCDHEYLLA